MIFGCIVAVIVLFVLLAIPYMISYKIACEYARTLPEEEREKFWNEYIIELNNDQYRGICPYKGGKNEPHKKREL